MAWKISRWVHCSDAIRTSTLYDRNCSLVTSFRFCRSRQHRQTLGPVVGTVRVQESQQWPFHSIISGCRSRCFEVPSNPEDRSCLRPLIVAAKLFVTRAQVPSLQLLLSGRLIRCFLTVDRPELLRSSRFWTKASAFARRHHLRVLLCQSAGSLT